MSRELDCISDESADAMVLIRPHLKPYFPPEIAHSPTDESDLGSLAPPKLTHFNSDLHRANLELLVGRWVPVLFGMLMVLTFGLLAFGPKESSDVAVQCAALFLSLISGITGYLFGRRTQG